MIKHYCDRCGKEIGKEARCVCSVSLRGAKTQMNKYKLLSQLLIVALIVIAAVVAIILATGKSAWILIIVYWIVLTAKNIVDLIVFRKNK